MAALGIHQLARWLRLNRRDVKTIGSRKDLYSEHFRLEETTCAEVSGALRRGNVINVTVEAMNVILIFNLAQ